MINLKNISLFTLLSCTFLIIPNNVHANNSLNQKNISDNKTYDNILSSKRSLRFRGIIDQNSSEYYNLDFNKNDTLQLDLFNEDYEKMEAVITGPNGFREFLDKDRQVKIHHSGTYTITFRVKVKFSKKEENTSINYIARITSVNIKQ